MVGFLPKKVEVRNDLFTQEKKGLRTASAGNLKLGILSLDREGRFFLKKALIRLISS